MENKFSQQCSEKIDLNIYLRSIEQNLIETVRDYTEQMFADDHRL